jgi:hypothetical protein
MHHPDGRPKMLNLDESRRLAHIAQMPDFVSTAESLRQSGGAAIMCVRENSDPHFRKFVRNTSIWQRRT